MNAMTTSEITIADHYDTLAIIRPDSDPVIEFEMWQFYASRNPQDWSGDEFTLADFEEYISSLLK